MSNSEVIAEPVATLMPRVSIGMPVYNAEKFIREAFDSLLGQSFTDFELIISDNASTDGTAAICLEYERNDSRVRYIRQTHNRGAWSNFQFVLDQSAGEYFMWAAADDLWNPRFIESTLQAHSKGDFANVFTRYHNASRRFPSIKSYKIPFIHGLASPDPQVRLRAFWGVPWGCTRANLIYGLWKKAPLINIFSEVEAMGCGQNGIDLALLTVGLLKYPFRQLDATMFIKMHKSLPCGHFLAESYNLIRLIGSAQMIQTEGRDSWAFEPLSKKYPEHQALWAEDYNRNANIWHRLLSSIRLGVFSSKAIFP